MNNPKHPSIEIVQHYIAEWKKLESYTLQEKSLNLLFHEYCPENTQIEKVLLKVSALNDFYSTNIYDTYSVAKHILKCDIDSDLRNGRQALVNKIAPVKIAGKTRNFYSFSSKYCSHHMPEAYPIYDSYVEKMLMYFKKKDKYEKFVKSDLKNYNRFVELIVSFQEYYGLSSCSLREIDIYLWLAGKEHFPNRYKKA